MTYERSREARISESSEQTVYQRIYDAERPELFFRAVPWRVVTHGEPIAVRADSPLNVPEPELGLVVNRHGETVGYLVVNDVSSRTIEGENPLLPQAKVYAGSCAVSTAVVPVWEVRTRRPDNPHDRAPPAAAAYEETTSTAAFHRGLPPHPKAWSHTCCVHSPFPTAPSCPPAPASPPTWTSPCLPATGYTSPSTAWAG